MAASIKIKVGASLESSALTVYKPLVKAAQDARRTIQKELNQGAAAMAGPYRTNARQIEGALHGVGKTAKQQADAMTRDVERSARERVRLEKQAMREIEADLRRSSKERERIEASGGGGRGRRPDFGYRMGYWSMRNFAPVTPMLSMGTRLAGDIARGVGIKTDVSSYLQSYVEREKLAQDISASGYQPGTAGPNSARVGKAAIMAEATAAGNVAGYDPTEALKGLQQFVGLTGDLDTGRKVLTDMAKVARATGSNLDDVVTAAGEIAAKLPEGTDKATALHEAMLQIAGAGKLGAVEMRDMAKQLGAVAAQAPSITGDMTKNLATLGAIMQETRQLGGAKSAPQAATAIGAFMGLFSKAARVKAFQSATGESYLDKSTGLMRDPRELILTMLAAASKGGVGAGFDKVMGNIVASSQARRATRGFETIFRRAYNETGGSAGDKQKAGLAAVDAEFKRLTTQAKMGTPEFNESLAEALDTTAVKAQRFQNELQQTADTVMARLLPALERLVPNIERGASAFGELLVWMTENPGKAVGAALGASIAKAGIENVARLGIETAFSAIGAGPLAAATLAIAAMTVTALYVDSIYNKKEAQQKAEIGNQLGAQNIMGQVSAAGGIASPEQIAQMQGKREALAKQLAAEQAKGSGATEGGFAGIAQAAAIGAGGLWDLLSGQNSTSEAIDKNIQEHTRQVMALKDSIASLDATLARQGIKPQPVTIVGGGGVQVDTSARAPGAGGAMPQAMPFIVP